MTDTTDSARCVYCRQHDVDTRFRPFCSERCRMLDLGAWIDGRYRVAADTPSDDDVESDDEEAER